MSYKKAYPNLSFRSRLIDMKHDEGRIEADVINNKLRNQKNYGGTVQLPSVNSQGPNGNTNAVNPVARVRLDFPVYPDDNECVGDDATYARHDLDPFLNPIGDVGDQNPIQTGARVNLKAFGNDPAYNGKVNNLRIQNGSSGDSTAMQSLGGAGVGIANLSFGQGTVVPSKPKKGKSHLSQGTLTKDSQIPGSAMPATTKVTSGYGYRIHPIKKVKKFHAGLDYSGGKRSAAKWKKGADRVGPKAVATKPADIEPCFTIFDGEVTKLKIKLGSTSGYGGIMHIEHKVKDKGGTERTIQSRYGHIEYSDLKVGDKVKKGQKVAHIGSQGGSTGPHLHFEVRESGKALDPLELLGWQYGAPPPPAPAGEEEDDFPQENLDKGAVS